jgi:hypothetical protein
MAPYPSNNQTRNLGRTLILFFCFVASQDSSVSTVKEKNYGLDYVVRFLAGVKIYLFFSPRVQTGCGIPPALFSVDNEGQSLGMKRPRRDSYDSPPSYD